MPLALSFTSSNQFLLCIFPLCYGYSFSRLKHIALDGLDCTVPFQVNEKPTKIPFKENLRFISNNNK